MKYHFHFFGPVLICIYLAFHLYFLRWTGRYFELSPRRSRAFRVWLAAMAALFPAAEYLERGAAGGPMGALSWFGFVWLGSIFIIVTVLFLCDLVYACLRLFRAARPARKTLGALSLALAAALVILAVRQGAALPKVRHVDIVLRGLPPSLDGFRIVQISDTHFSRLTPADRMRKLAAAVNALAPDLVVFTGDITEHGIQDRAVLCSAIGSISAKYGKAGVLGNHDSFTDPDGAAAFFGGCGIRMLRFEKYGPVPGLDVAGVDDPRRGAPRGRSMELLVGALSPSRPVVFLSHRPEGFDAALKAAPCLVLSGHTHQGQIQPFGLIERPMFKYFHGLYRAGDSSVYVTSGAGTWGPPMRLFTASELPLFVLHPESGTGSSGGRAVIK